MVRLYKKELPDNPLYLSSGKKVRFQKTQSGLGILASDNEELINELARISGKRGGLTEITEEEFRALRDGADRKTAERINLPAEGPVNGERPGIDQLYIKWRIAQGRFAFNPVSPPRQKIGKIIHVLERHPQKNENAEKRVRAAFESWLTLYKTGSVIPMHVWNYRRSAVAIGETRDLPYLKDILQSGMEISRPGDLIMLTNDDTLLHEETPIVVRRMMQNLDALSSFRLNFPEGKIPSMSEKLSKIRKRGDPCLGRDLFCFRREWLHANWDSIPDFILGELEWDLVMATIVRRAAGVLTTKANFHEVLPECELPRGYVLHEIHERNWVDPKYANSPAKLHNNRLMCEWNADNGFESLIGKLL